MQRVLGEVQRLPGVTQAAPGARAARQRRRAVRAARRGADRRRPAPRAAAGQPAAASSFRYAQIAHLWALAVPAPSPRDGRANRWRASSCSSPAGTSPRSSAPNCPDARIGALAQSPVLIAPLAYAQHLAGMPGALTRIFVARSPGHERAGARGPAARWRANALNVEPADFDARLFGVAAAPIDQGDGPVRRDQRARRVPVRLQRDAADRAVASGADRQACAPTALRARASSQALLFDALMLGGAAAVLGLALGDALSLLVFGASPGYLSFAFPVGSQRIVTWQSVAVAAGAGMLAACVGVLAPMRGVPSQSPPARQPRPGRASLAAAGLGLARARAWPAFRRRRRSCSPRRSRPCSAA